MKAKTHTMESELVRAAKQVATTGKRRVIRSGGVSLAVLVPCDERGTAPVEKPQKTAKPRRRSGILAADDPLFELIGIGDSGIEGGISGHKHEYMAQKMRHT